MAPFVDTDGNGMYSPDMGDIPQMKGNSMAYMIVNDDRMNHSVSGANKLGIEAHYMVYQLDGSEELENTTFIDLTLYNRTNSAIYDFVTSFWTEVFLGNLFDNYVGSNPSKNLVYAYNGSNTDEFGYGENPPAFGIMSLCEPISSALSYPESGTINGVWNTMNGLNLDGSNLLDNNGQATKFQYSGIPSVSGSYSEMQLSNEPGHKKTILSFEMGIFEPSFDDALGMTIPKKISLAVIYSRTGDHLENVNSLFETADVIQEYYDQYLSSCFINSADINPLTSDNRVSLYPNPTNNLLTITTELAENYSGKIISITGQEVHSFSATGKSTNIDCSHLESGMYILQLTDGSKIISKQFVKAD